MDPGRRALGQLRPLGRPLAGCRSWTRAQTPESQSPQAGRSGDGDPRPGLAVSPVSKQASVQAGGRWGRRRRTLGHRHSEVHAADSTLLPALTAGPCLLEENPRVCEDVCVGAHIQAGSLGPLPASSSPALPQHLLVGPQPCSIPLDIPGASFTPRIPSTPPEHPTLLLLLVSSLVNHHPPGRGPGTKATLTPRPCLVLCCLKASHQHPPAPGIMPQTQPTAPFHGFLTAIRINPRPTSHLEPSQIGSHSISPGLPPPSARPTGLRLTDAQPHLGRARRWGKGTPHNPPGLTQHPQSSVGHTPHKSWGSHEHQSSAKLP